MTSCSFAAMRVPKCRKSSAVVTTRKMPLASPIGSSEFDVSSIHPATRSVHSDSATIPGVQKLKLEHSDSTEAFS